jgi:hypothetical protein
LSVPILTENLLLKDVLESEYQQWVLEALPLIISPPPSNKQDE